MSRKLARDVLSRDRQRGSNLRALPTAYFVLVRSYLRLDLVLLRLCSVHIVMETPQWG
jgi:hypothetical protein